MAEGYLVKRLKDEGIEGTSVFSAGTFATPGLKPTDETIKIMKENGVDVSGHLSSLLNKAHIDTADIILLVEPYHKEKILDLLPDADDKIYYLRRFASEVNRKKDRIEDPIGKPIEFYREVFDIIQDSVEGLLEWLMETHR